MPLVIERARKRRTLSCAYDERTTPFSHPSSAPKGSRGSVIATLSHLSQWRCPTWCPTAGRIDNDNISRRSSSGGGGDAVIQYGSSHTCQNKRTEREWSAQPSRRATDSVLPGVEPRHVPTLRVASRRRCTSRRKSLSSSRTRYDCNTNDVGKAAREREIEKGQVEGAKNTTPRARDTIHTPRAPTADCQRGARRQAARRRRRVGEAARLSDAQPRRTL